MSILPVNVIVFEKMGEFSILNFDAGYPKSQLNFLFFLFIFLLET